MTQTAKEKQIVIAAIKLGAKILKQRRAAKQAKRSKTIRKIIRRVVK